MLCIYSCNEECDFTQKNKLFWYEEAKKMFRQYNHGGHPKLVEY